MVVTLTRGSETTTAGILFHHNRAIILKARINGDSQQVVISRVSGRERWKKPDEEAWAVAPEWLAQFNEENPLKPERGPYTGPKNIHAKCAACPKEAEIELTSEGAYPDPLPDGWYWSCDESTFYCGSCTGKIIRGQLQALQALCDERGIPIVRT